MLAPHTMQSAHSLHSTPESATEAAEAVMRLNPASDRFPCFTPMVVLPFSVFRSLDHVPRSDEAKAKAMLVQFEATRHECVFMSHNWWTRNTGSQVHDAGFPDIADGPDRNLKYRVCCRGLDALFAEGVLDATKELVVWMVIYRRFTAPTHLRVPIPVQRAHHPIAGLVLYRAG